MCRKERVSATINRCRKIISYHDSSSWYIRSKDYPCVSLSGAVNTTSPIVIINLMRDVLNNNDSFNFTAQS